MPRARTRPVQLEEGRTTDALRASSTPTRGNNLVGPGVSSVLHPRMHPSDLPDHNHPRSSTRRTCRLRYVRARSPNSRVASLYAISHRLVVGVHREVRLRRGLFTAGASDWLAPDRQASPRAFATCLAYLIASASNSVRAASSTS
jgi:hypothetical protein